MLAILIRTSPHGVRTFSHRRARVWRISSRRRTPSVVVSVEDQLRQPACMLRACTKPSAAFPDDSSSSAPACTKASSAPSSNNRSITYPNTCGFKSSRFASSTVMVSDAVFAASAFDAYSLRSSAAPHWDAPENPAIPRHIPTSQSSSPETPRIAKPESSQSPRPSA